MLGIPGKGFVAFCDFEFVPSSAALGKSFQNIKSLTVSECRCPQYCPLGCPGVSSSGGRGNISPSSLVALGLPVLRILGGGSRRLGKAARTKRRRRADGAEAVDDATAL